MSWQPATPPQAEAAPAGDPLELIIAPRRRDLGGFEMRRVLPAAARMMVGPFIFFDVMGPVTFDPGRGIDVRPHPHIGLATVTYLFAGEIVHRDSLGNVQAIVPGDVNWMTAGRGIAHSERTDPAKRQVGRRLSGVQSWVALPRRDEETAPAFVHHPAAALPIVDGEGKTLRLIAGALFGARAPTETFSEMFYADAALEPGARLALAPEHEERAVFIAEGSVEIGGQSHGAGDFLVLRPGGEVVLRADGSAARLLLLGGATMDGPRHIWWNFVSISKDRIAAAKADWKAGRFAAVIGETELTPLPE
jgi:redox-sensitive bicupin YhaK (pirin superfamily)